MIQNSILSSLISLGIRIPIVLILENEYCIFKEEKHDARTRIMWGIVAGR